MPLNSSLRIPDDANVQYYQSIIANYADALTFLRDAASELSDDADGGTKVMAKLIELEEARKNEFVADRKLKRDPFDEDSREEWIDAIDNLAVLEKEAGIYSELEDAEKEKIETGDALKTKAKNRFFSPKFIGPSMASIPFLMSQSLAV